MPDDDDDHDVAFLANQQSVSLCSHQACSCVRLKTKLQNRFVPKTGFEPPKSFDLGRFCPTYFTLFFCWFRLAQRGPEKSRKSASRAMESADRKHRTVWSVEFNLSLSVDSQRRSAKSSDHSRSCLSFNGTDTRLSLGFRVQGSKFRFQGFVL